MRLQFSDFRLLIPLRKSIFDVERSMLDVHLENETREWSFIRVKPLAQNRPDRSRKKLHSLAKV